MAKIVKKKLKDKNIGNFPGTIKTMWALKSDRPGLNPVPQFAGSLTLIKLLNLSEIGTIKLPKVFIQKRSMLRRAHLIVF